MTRSFIPHEILTSRDAGMVITDKSGGKIGCTIRLQNGLWAAWNRHKKIGEYKTQGAAANAAFRAPKRAVSR